MTWRPVVTEGRVVYRTIPGSRIPQGEVQAVGEYLETLGNVTAPSLLEAARPAESIVHRYFEWDDSVAAEKYRVEQAEHILRHIDIVVVNVETEEVSTTRAVHPVTVEDNRDTRHPRRMVYTPVMQVHANPDQRSEVLQRALRELRGWQARYRMYQEFEPIFSVINSLAL
jgi:hypothetical protein